MSSFQAKIHCHKCNHDYYVYRSNLQHNVPVNCPNCDSKIDDMMWNMLVDAALTVDEVNYHFRKYHSERNEDLFCLSVECTNSPTEVKNT